MKSKHMKSKPYLITIGTIILLRSLDLLSTYIYMPELEAEYNPVVSIFGASWRGLIATQIALIILISFIGRFYFFMPVINVTVPNLSFSDFIYVYFFGKLRSWPQRLWSIPTDHKPHLIFNGFLFVSVAIVVSIFAICNNTLLIFEVTWYYDFLLAHYSHFFPIVYGVIVVCSAFMFFSLQFLKYRKQQNILSDKN